MKLLLVFNLDPSQLSYKYLKKHSLFRNWQKKNLHNRNIGFNAYSIQTSSRWFPIELKVTQGLI